MTFSTNSFHLYQSIVFLILFLSIVLLTYALRQGILRRQVIFEAKDPVPFFQAVKIAFSTETGEKGIWGKLKAKKAILDELRTRGEWVEAPSGGDDEQGASATVQGRAFGDDFSSLHNRIPPPAGPGAHVGLARVPSDEDSANQHYHLNGQVVFVDTPASGSRRSSLGRVMESLGNSFRRRSSIGETPVVLPPSRDGAPVSASWLTLTVRDDFLGKMGPMFTDYVEKRWWYVSWCMLRNLMTGLFIGVVKPTVPNSAIITVLYVFDFIFVGGFFPHAVCPAAPCFPNDAALSPSPHPLVFYSSQDKWTNFVEAYTLMTRCLSLGCVTAYMGGSLLPDQLTNGTRTLPLQT